MKLINQTSEQTHVLEFEPDEEISYSCNGLVQAIANDCFKGHITNYMASAGMFRIHLSGCSKSELRSMVSKFKKECKASKIGKPSTHTWSMRDM